MCACACPQFLTESFMQADIARKDRLVTVAMSARAEAQTAYQEMKQNTTDLERRFRETQVHTQNLCFGPQLPAPVKHIRTVALAALWDSGLDHEATVPGALLATNSGWAEHNTSVRS